MTCNQNLVIANVAARDRGKIDKLVEKYGLDGYKQQSGIRRHSIACVALPTCGLAMAESERYAPVLLPKLEALLEKQEIGRASGRERVGQYVENPGVAGTLK